MNFWISSVTFLGPGIEYFKLNFFAILVIEFLPLNIFHTSPPVSLSIHMFPSSGLNKRVASLLLFHTTFGFRLGESASVFIFISDNNI